MEIKIYSNNNAVKFMNKKINQHECLKYNPYIMSWLNVQAEKRCYALFLNECIVNFALVSANDYDPLATEYPRHTRPTTLEYIYTFLEYRRNNLALNVLRYLKKKNK